MAARYTLHGFWASGPTYKIALFLSLAGEAFDYVHVDLPTGEHTRPPYLVKQRFGQVPLLVDNSNGRHLCQSAAILEYLADRTGKFGGASLDERLTAREWMFWEADRLAPGVYRPRSARAGLSPLPEEVIGHYLVEGRAALELLDDALRGRSWIVGEAPTIADIDIYGVVAYAAEAGHALEPLQNLGRWTDRVAALPGFAAPNALLRPPSLRVL